MTQVEICVDSLAGLEAALDGGADRIELCSALSLGGLTPTPGLIAAARAACVPIMAMIRPREGDFVWSTAEVALMCDEIAAIRVAGLAGVVIGASLSDGRLDEAALARLVDAAQGLDITLHRAVDLCPDPVAAVGAAARLGIGRILSSGGAVCAVDGLDRLEGMVLAAGDRVSIMPGAGVTPQNAPGIVARLGVREIHASCSDPVPQSAAAQAFGFSQASQAETSSARVSELVAALA